MAKKKSSERTFMWVFGVVAVVALLGVVALAFGDGVTGMIDRGRWTSPVFGTKTGIITESVKQTPTSGLPSNAVVSVTTADGISHTTGTVILTSPDATITFGFGKWTQGTGGYGMKWTE